MIKEMHFRSAMLWQAFPVIAQHFGFLAFWKTAEFKPVFDLQLYSHLKSS